jgi:hypothetical protein
MTTEQELRQKLRKISALFEGATTAGERDAAAAAIDRVKKALTSPGCPSVPIRCFGPRTLATSRVNIFPAVPIL